MAFEGLLAKLGPTLVREVTPHVLQLVGGLTERFRRDTNEIKAAVDAEMTTIVRTHAGLATGLNDQRERLEALGDQISAVDRRVELLHRAVESLTRQAARDTAEVVKGQRSTRNLALTSAIFSALACGAAAALFFLHR